MRIIQCAFGVVAVAATSCTGTFPRAAVISMNAECDGAVPVGLPVEDRGHASDSRAQIRVHVRSAAGGAPVADARVALRLGREEIATTATDSSGEALLRAPEGAYHLEVGLLGFRTTRSELRLQSGRYYVAYVPIWTRPIC